MARAVWQPPGRRAVLTFVALAIVFLVPWPGLPRAFAAAFAVFARVVVGALGLGGDAPPTFGLPATGAVAASDGGGWAVMFSTAAAALPLDTRIIAYTPLAIFVALVLATPAARRQKLALCAWGLALLGARLVFAIAVPVARASGSTSALASAAEIAWWSLITPPVMSYAAPLLAWWVALSVTTPAAATTPPAPSGRDRSRRPRRARAGRLRGAASPPR